MLFNEPKLLKFTNVTLSALDPGDVSVLFNEPKLLKWETANDERVCPIWFQCSSTSRNC